MTCRPGEMMNLTYTAMNTFRNCPKKYELRYLHCLRPREKSDALMFGSIIHGALEIWYTSVNEPNALIKVLAHIDDAFPDRGHDPEQKNFWMHARAMMTSYARAYAQEDFEVLAIEKEFTGPIHNPETGAKSQTFQMSGKVDGIVQCKDGVYLLEHKTASCIDASYIDKLWTDSQITLYSLYLRQMGYPVIGVIYNVLLKSRLRQKSGESEEEYEQRKSILAAKNRSGKSTAKRQEPESDEEFLGRLYDWYSRPEAFHRERIFLSDDRLKMVEHELWDVTQQFLHARRRDSFLMNTSYCFNWSRPCEYFQYCQSGFNPIVRENLFDVAEPHEELTSVNSSF